MTVARRCALLLLTVILSAGCIGEDGSTEGDRPGAAELSRLLERLPPDPQRSRDFLTGVDDARMAEVAEEAELPRAGRLTHLLAERDLTRDDSDRLGAALLAATGDGVDTAQARSQVDQILDELLTSAGRTSAEGDIDSRLLEPVAEVLARHIGHEFDDLVNASASSRWTEDPVRGLLHQLATDLQASERFAAAASAEVTHRLDRHLRSGNSLQQAIRDVGVPYGRAMGALADETDDREGAESVIRAWARRNTREAALQTWAAGEVGRAFAVEYASKQS